MALRRFTFHSELFEQEGSTMSHIALYGAVEMHADGPKGCIASNKVLAQETGVGERTITNLLTKMKSFGWIDVVVDKQNRRKKIVPLLAMSATRKNVAKKSTVTDTELHSDVYRVEGSRKVPKGTAQAQDITDSESISDSQSQESSKSLGKGAEKSEALKYYYQVLKHHSVPVVNNNHVKGWADKLLKQLKTEEAVKNYCTVLMDDEFMGYTYAPQIYKPIDVFQKVAAVRGAYERYMEGEG